LGAGTTVCMLMSAITGLWVWRHRTAARRQRLAAGAMPESGPMIRRRNRTGLGQNAKWLSSHRPRPRNAALDSGRHVGPRRRRNRLPARRGGYFPGRYRHYAALIRMKIPLILTLACSLVLGSVPGARAEATPDAGTSTPRPRTPRPSWRNWWQGPRETRPRANLPRKP